MSSTKLQVYKASDTALHPGRYYYFVETRQKVPGQTIYDKESRKQVPNPSFDLSKYEIIDKPSGRRPNSQNTVQPASETIIHHKFTIPQLSEALNKVPDVHVSSIAKSYFRKTSHSIQDVLSKIDKIKQDHPGVNFISYSNTKNQLLLSTRNQDTPPTPQ